MAASTDLSTELVTGVSGCRLLRRLGQGATSTVWLAEHPETRERLALKFASSPAHRNRLADEAERLLWVDSPALVRVLGAGLTKSELVAASGRGAADVVARGTPYVALEWVQGRALSVASDQGDEDDAGDDGLEPLILSDERLSSAARVALALSVARDVGQALCDLHALGVAHGDIKPTNIIVNGPELAESGACQARLVDLGLGGASGERAVHGGTPRYFAPEVLSTEFQSDARARDLWALGVALAEIGDVSVARAADPAAAALRGRLQAPLDSLVSALLCRAPGARPSARWVHWRALRALGASQDAATLLEHRRSAVRRAYLKIRRHEVLAAARSKTVHLHVSGAPQRWLENAIAVARSVAELRGRSIERKPYLVEALDLTNQSRWLVALVGSAAAAWPARKRSDEELAQSLLSLVERFDPESLSFSLLDSENQVSNEGQSSEGRSSGPRSREPVEIALELAREHPDPETLDAAEELVSSGLAPESLGRALGRKLRLSGQLGRALAVLERVPGAAALTEAAETARRARDLEMAESYLGRIALGTCDARTSSRRSAILARIALDRGQPEQPITILRGTEATAATAEVLALTHDALGQRNQARSELERGRLLAEDDEERARMEGVAGVLAHREDDSAGELSAYRAAAKHAQRAGAVLEEATYLSGVAAAATQLGELGEALSAAQRSTLLFEYLGRGKEAARAALARVAAYAHVGAEAEAREAAMDALRRAKSMRDPLCQGYVHLALAIALPAESAEAADQAERAWLLLREGQPADRLWAAARMLRSEKGELDLPELDRLARQSSISVPARLDWWGARARAALSNPTAATASSVVAELIALSTVRAAPAVRGPSLAAGGELATRLGDGEAARRLASAAAEAARELMARVPDELKVAVEGLEWVRAVKAPSEGVFSPEQLKNVEALVRALGHRDRLKTLLGQVLDALVLWTGVERGLLLLRAPGGRLRPRVARNLAREDLSREQLELSYSLAERALALGEPVVAVDAAGELPEVHQSVHALKLRSVLAVPLVAHGQALGVVYLDDRGRRGAFGPRELGWVRLIATLAAVAIADARDQLLLRRAARKAERAQGLLADELARREAELDAVARELARSRDARETRFSYEAIIGQSEPVRRMLRVVDRVVASEVPVLIFGESGSGKELVARAIHEHGPRKSAPFVTENCSAIPESLLESALFGHVRGAFTGALRPRAGLFEIADRGTLFLDEIGEMSLRMQSELLRVLEDGEIRPVGSERARKVDVRVIGATHRNLEELVREKRFREDLFYRLNVISVLVPTLRERPGDIPLLVRHMISAYAKGRRVRISKVALDSLTACLWPGNVRQLQNEIRRALVLADDVIELEHLSADVRGSEGPSSDDLNVRGRLDALETELVKSALERTQGNQTRAAELLGVSRFGLHKMMRRLEIEWQERRSAG